MRTHYHNFSSASKVEILAGVRFAAMFSSALESDNLPLEPNPPLHSGEERLVLKDGTFLGLSEGILLLARMNLLVLLLLNLLVPLESLPTVINTNINFTSQQLLWHDAGYQSRSP